MMIMQDAGDDNATAQLKYTTLAKSIKKTATLIYMLYPFTYQ